MSSEQVGPLAGTSGNLFGDVRQVGERLAIAIGGDGREALVVALHLSVGAEREGIAAPELLIQSEGAFSHARVIGLDRRSVVAEFGIEDAASEEAAITNLTADVQLHGCIFGVRGCVCRAALPGWNQNVAVGAK